MASKLLAFAAGVALMSTNVLAASPAQPYAGQQQRPIKTMSMNDINGHLQGLGLGYAKTAELNHYPGPAHLRELSLDLGLSEDLLAQIKRIEDDMRAQAQALGKEIIKLEQQLDLMFAHANIDAETVRFLTTRIGELRGQLRAVHLNAHLQTRPLLSENQVARYDKLRGYTQAASSDEMDMKGEHHGH